MSRERIERIPLRLARYAWTVRLSASASVSGWTLTRWGARREIRRALADPPVLDVERRPR